MTGGERGSRWWRGGLRRLAAGGVGLAVLALVAAGGVAKLRSADRPAAARPAPATTEVTRGDLVEVRTVPGTLAYGPELAGVSRLTGTVTAIAPLGSTVERGEALFRIDDRPVVLMYGGLPAYRELTAGRAAEAAPAVSAVPAVPAAPAGAGHCRCGRPAVRGEPDRARLRRVHGRRPVHRADVAKAGAAGRHDAGLPQTGDVELGGCSTHPDRSGSPVIRPYRARSRRGRC